MKKRVLAMAMALCLALPLLPVSAGAVNDDGTITADRIRYRVTGEDTVSVISNRDESPAYPDMPHEGVGIGQSTYSGDIVIPEFILDGGKTYTVTCGYDKNSGLVTTVSIVEVK